MNDIYTNTPEAQSKFNEFWDGIKIRTKKTTLVSSHSSRWTSEEEEILRQNYKKWKMEELENVLNRSVSSISTRASILGLKDKKAFFTKQEDDYIKRNYGNSTIKEIAKKLNRPLGSVQARISKLKLKKHEVQKQTTGYQIKSKYVDQDGYEKRHVFNYKTEPLANMAVDRAIDCLTRYLHCKSYEIYEVNPIKPNYQNQRRNECEQ